MHKSKILQKITTSLNFIDTDKFLISVFYFVLLVTVILQITHMQNYVNSDAAADILYAKEMASTNSLLPATWYHSTEVFLIGIFSLAAIFLKLLPISLLTAKILANLTAIALLLGSFYFLGKVCQISRKYIYLGMTILLTPLFYSIYTMLYIGAEYSLYAAFVFFTLANVILLETKTTNNKFLLFVLFFFNILFSLQSTRVLATVLGPLFIAACFLLLSKKISLKTVLFIFLLIVVNAIGMKIAQLYIYNHIHASDISRVAWRFDSAWVKFRLVATIGCIVKAFHLIPKKGEAFSNGTVFNIISILFFIFVVAAFKVIIPLRNINNLIDKKTWFSQLLLAWFAIFSFCVSFYLIVFADFSTVLSARYFLSFFIIIPFLACFIVQNKPAFFANYDTKAIICFLLVVVLSSFLSERLSFGDPLGNSKRYNIISFLEKNNISFGYASFWNADITTFLSNNKLETATFASGGNKANDKYLDFSPHLWLTFERYYKKPYSTKVPFFLLLGKSEETFFDKDILSKGKKAYSDHDFVVYIFNNPELLNPAIYFPKYLFTKVGTLVNGMLTTNSKSTSGALNYGPYVRLVPGTYTVDFFYSSNSPIIEKVGYVDVAENGNSIVKHDIYGTYGKLTKQTLTFNVPKYEVRFKPFDKNYGYEYRTFFLNGNISLEKIVVTNKSS